MAEPPLRLARAEDAHGIVELLAAVAAEGLIGIDPATLDPRAEAARLRGWNVRDACALVAADAAGIGGFALAVRGPGPATAHTASVSVAVSRDRRRRGLGRLLLSGLRAWAGAAGVVKLCAGVCDRNAPALALFHRSGYAVEGIRRGQIALAGGVADEVLMGALLGGAAGDG